MMAFASIIHRFAQLPVAAALTFLLGLVTGPVFIAANTIVHEVSRDEMRGRVFSALEVVMHLGFLLAMFLSAHLSETLGVANFKILIGVGCLFAFVGLFGLLQYKKQERLLSINGEGK